MPASQPSPDVLASLDLAPDGTARRRRRWPWVVAILVALGLLVAAAVVLAPRPQLYATAPVIRGTLRAQVSAVGKVEPRQDVTVGSDLSGIVAEVRVNSLDRVEAGDVLAVLDDATFRAQRDQAAAGVKVAEASLLQATIAADEAARALVRAEGLGSDVLAEQALDQARTAAARAAAAREAAAAQLAAAKATLATAEAALRKTVIRAPIAGIVLERHVDPGQTVVSALQAAPLFRIAEDLGHMLVRVEVDEADVGRVKPGQRATFTVAAWPRRVFDAVVEKVEPAPKPIGVVVTYEAELAVDNPDRALLPGMTATATIISDTGEEVLLVPPAALRWEPPDAPPAQGARVWVLDGDVPRPVPVERLGSQDDRVAVLSDGLTEGQLVITGFESGS